MPLFSMLIQQHVNCEVIKIFVSPFRINRPNKLVHFIPCPRIPPNPTISPRSNSFGNPFVDQIPPFQNSLPNPRVSKPDPNFNSKVLLEKQDIVMDISVTNKPFSSQIRPSVTDLSVAQSVALEPVVNENHQAVTKVIVTENWCQTVHHNC